MVSHMAQSAIRKPVVARSVTLAEQSAKPSLLTVQRGTVIGRGHTGDVTLSLEHEPIQVRPLTHVKSLIK